MPLYLPKDSMHMSFSDTYKKLKKVERQCSITQLLSSIVKERLFLIREKPIFTSLMSYGQHKERDSKTFSL
jgi:hypothetical protein